MSLRQRIQDDMTSALKAGDKKRLGTIRLAYAAIKQREIDERVVLTDQQVLETLDKMVKQRRESIVLYEQGGRADLAEQERFEIGVLQQYLPDPLSDAEIDALIAKAIAETGAEGIRDMGKVMAVVKPAVQGRADVGAVSAKVKDRLTSS
ncbi:MAG: GatB/YqeY domain-containing protein [Gammaproteobacteria bacterium]